MLPPRYHGNDNAGGDAFALTARKLFMQNLTNQLTCIIRCFAGFVAILVLFALDGVVVAQQPANMSKPSRPVIAAESSTKHPLIKRLQEKLRQRVETAINEPESADFFTSRASSATVNSDPASGQKGIASTARRVDVFMLQRTSESEISDEPMARVASRQERSGDRVAGMVNPVGNGTGDRTEDRDWDFDLRPIGSEQTVFSTNKIMRAEIDRAIDSGRDIGQDDFFQPRNDLGFSLIDASPLRGVVVDGITDQSVAQRSGLMIGDRVVAINHRLIRDLAAWERESRKLGMNTAAQIQIVRSDRLMRVELFSAADRSDRDDADVADHSRRSGGQGEGQFNAINQQATATANALGQAVLGGLGAAFQGLFETAKEDDREESSQSAVSKD